MVFGLRDENHFRRKLFHVEQFEKAEESTNRIFAAGKRLDFHPSERKISTQPVDISRVA